MHVPANVVLRSLWRLRAAAGAAVLVLLLIAAPRAEAVKVVRVTSPGGIEAWLVEDHSNPILALELSFEGGSALDPKGKAGMADMVAGLLDEGAGDLDSQAFQRKLEDLSIGLDFGAGYDTFNGSLKTLTKNRDVAVDLLRLALMRPRFDREPVERVRNQLLAVIARAEKNPSRIASRRWWGQVFPEHPYGRPGHGTAETVKGIATADLRGFVGRRFARSNLYVAVAGDIRPDELGRLLDRAFGELPEKAAPDEVRQVEPVLDGEVTVIRRPMPQSIVVFGQEGVARDDPDWYTAYVLNHILGGGSFTSRLMKEVREKRGLAYSISTWLNPMDHAAVLAGSVGTENARVGQSIELIRQEWARLRERGITEDELADAKRYLTGSFPLQLDSTGSIARILITVQRHGLGIDYLDRRRGYIEAVTVADVERVAKRLLAPDKLTFVVVGEPEGVGAAAGGDGKG